MIVKPDLVKKIKEYFDLNIYETKIWIALLSKGIVSAGEAAELSGVPRSRTYDVLESLEKRGFAIVKIGKPVKYIAVEPKAIIEKMKSNVMTDANDRVKSLANLKQTSEYTELEQLHKTGISPIKTEEVSGFVRGKSNVSSKLRELLSNAEKEIAIYTTLSDFDRKSRVLLPAIEEANKKNIKIKIALTGESEDIKKTISKNNLKAKYSEHKGRFFIADKTQVLFMLNNESAEEELAVWLKSQFFTESIDTMFDTYLKNIAK